MPSNENLSISEIIFISMEENNINHDHIDLRLNCIENSINKIEKHLSNNITDIKTVDEKEFTINSMYENAKEFKDFIKDKLGYQLIVNSDFIKLEKIPNKAEPWMKIEDFDSPIQYALLCVVLMYLEDKEKVRVINQ